MKIQAYICDYCENPYLEDDICALIIEQPDLFREVYDYKATVPHKPGLSVKNNPYRYDIHFCLHCLQLHVYDLIKGIDRSRDEADYKFHHDLYKKKFYEFIHRKALLRNSTSNRR